MNKKKLVIICGALTSGGAERVLSVLSKPLADEFNITLLLWRDKPVFYKYDERINIIPLPSISKFNNHISKGYALRKWINKEKPNIIVSFLRPFNLLALTSLVGIRIPKIVAERNDPRFTPGGWPIVLYTNLIYRTASGILCQTQSISNYFKGILSTRTHVIFNPIKLPIEKIGVALKTQKSNKIVIIGRLHSQKNHKLAIDAFKIFLQNHPTYKLSIYGEGPLKNEIQSYIENQALSDSIIMEGAKPDIIPYILDAKAFLMTSKFEGMPNALVEAMCLGIPCISTPVSGAIDLIKNEENGILVNWNPTDIASVLNKLVDDETKCYNLGNNASKLYDMLRIERISKQWINYFNSLA